jgi:hypothetical protein
MVLSFAPRAAAIGQTLFQKQSALRVKNSRPALRLEKISAGITRACEKNHKLTCPENFRELRYFRFCFGR